MESIPLAAERSVSPWLEMGAYECLWTKAHQSFKKIADLFREHNSSLPSDFVLPAIAQEHARQAVDILRNGKVSRFGVRLAGTFDYPSRLCDARNPLELFYFQGWWDLVATPCVAVVGTRNPTNDGTKRAAKLVRQLVADSYTIVSGLAAGIDTIAHTTAIECKGQTIAVLGTPLSHVYPRPNTELQQQIARDYLLISQVPIIRYSQQDWRANRGFFPERNITMSALTQATIIVEASDTSGTLTQARAAIQQRRKLFILDNCFRQTGLKWPWRYDKEGAIRVENYEDIRRHLGDKATTN